MGADPPGSSWPTSFRGDREQAPGLGAWDEQSEETPEGQDRQADGFAEALQGLEGHAPLPFRDRGKRLAAGVHSL